MLSESALLRKTRDFPEAPPSELVVSISHLPDVATRPP